jgi:S1-C subfamily serine protease
MTSRLLTKHTRYFYFSPICAVQLYKENTPAVVNLSNIGQARAPFSTDIYAIPQGQGSGFIWDDEGHVVTNFHVIRGASEVRVTLIDQSMYKARIVGGDPQKDVAVLQLEAPKQVLKQLKPMMLGQSSGLFVGQKVFAIGNPFGLDHTLTRFVRSLLLSFCFSKDSFSFLGI